MRSIVFYYCLHDQYLCACPAPPSLPTKNENAKRRVGCAWGRSIPTSPEVAHFKKSKDFKKLVSHKNLIVGIRAEWSHFASSYQQLLALRKAHHLSPQIPKTTSTQRVFSQRSLQIAECVLKYSSLFLVAK